MARLQSLAACKKHTEIKRLKMSKTGNGSNEIYSEKEEHSTQRVKMDGMMDVDVDQFA